MLVGRLAERRLLSSRLDAARSGVGGALIVLGEPGIGKSALLEFAASEAAEFRVLKARGVEAEAELPFSGLYELLRPLLEEMPAIPERQAAALRGAFGLGPPLDAPLMIGAGSLSLLAAAAEGRPLLCLIDDAHWLDAASATTLAFVARRVEADPIFMLFAARARDTRSLERAGIDELSLEGLDWAEGAELLRDAGLADDVAADLYAAASGNPLALLELPRALSEGQRSGLEALPTPLPATRAIQAAYEDRIKSLPEPTQEALLVAAAEPSCEAGVINRAYDALDISPLALGPAEDAGLLSLRDGVVVFHHPLVVAAAYHSRRPAEQRRAHAALAEAVPPEDRARQVWHLAKAVSGPDERVAAALADSARASYVRGGYRSAARTLERATTLTPSTERRTERLFLAAITHFYAHDIVRALALLEECERLSQRDPDRARYRLLRLALGYYRDVDRAAALLLEEAEAQAADPQMAARVAALAAFFRATIRDADGALAAARATRDYAARVGAELDSVATLGAGLGFIAGGKPAEAGELREHALNVLKAHDWRHEHPEDWMQGYVGAYAGGTLIVLGEHEALRGRIQALTADFVPGDEVSHMLAEGLLGTADFLAGRWQEARARISESVRVAEEMGWLGPQAYAAVRVLAQLAAAQGAADELARYEATASQYSGIGWASFVGVGSGGLLALGLRDYATAVECYEKEVFPRLGPLVLYHDVADAIEALVRLGRLVDAQNWLQRFSDQAQASGWPWALARTAHLSALMAGEEFEREYDEALAWHDVARQPFLRARTELALGARLRVAGLRRRAREHLRAALVSFENLAAEPWAQQTATELRATGERVARRRDPGVSQLTPQELQVALLVARGATNKEAAAQLFLSPKTIEKRLSAAYAKLGIRSRSELAHVFAQGEIVSEIVSSPTA